MNENRRDQLPVFTCRLCGECCRGRGGIVLRRRDSERLADFFGISIAALYTRYAERARGKYRLRAGADGHCVFFDADALCGVHAAKPDVCRAWPFFRGNLVDPISFAMAGEGCPGIVDNIDFAVFSEAGARYLLAQGLFVPPGEAMPPTVLMPEAALRQLAHSGKPAERSAR